MAEASVDPVPLLEVLDRHRVRHVLIGGWAAIVRGAPYFTEDVDITPNVDERNLERLAAALREIGARTSTPDEPDGVPFTIDAKSLTGNRIWNLVTDLGDLDIAFEPSGTRGWGDLTRDASDEELADGLVVSVASLADVIRSKQAAGRPKDLAVLPALRALQEA